MRQSLILLLVVVSVTTIAQQKMLLPSGKTVSQRVLTPKGYSRVPLVAGTFGAYLRNMPLLPSGAVVRYFDGTEKENNGVYVAVVDLNIGKKDLQQCADVIMHVRAEYLYSTNQKQTISFNFTNGFKASYAEWMKGYRIKVAGNKCSWVKAAAAGDSYESFLQFMDLVYMYAGTQSLAKELKPIRFDEMQPGDVLIKGGSPGHAELVMEVATNLKGQKIFILAQSYMPAQQMQILANAQNLPLSPWYEAGGKEIETPEWTFTSQQLMRFP